MTERQARCKGFICCLGGGESGAGGIHSWFHDNVYDKTPEGAWACVVAGWVAHSCSHSARRSLRRMLWMSPPRRGPAILPTCHASLVNRCVQPQSPIKVSASCIFIVQLLLVACSLTDS